MDTKPQQLLCVKGSLNQRCPSSLFDMPRYTHPHTYMSTISFQFSHIKITSDPSPGSNLPLSACTEPQSENVSLASLSSSSSRLAIRHTTSALTCPRHHPHMSCVYEEADEDQRTRPASDPSLGRISDLRWPPSGIPHAHSILHTPVTLRVSLKSTPRVSTQLIRGR